MCVCVSVRNLYAEFCVLARLFDSNLQGVYLYNPFLLGKSRAFFFWRWPQLETPSLLLGLCASLVPRPLPVGHVFFMGVVCHGVVPRPLHRKRYILVCMRNK